MPQTYPWMGTQQNVGMANPTPTSIPQPTNTPTARAPATPWTPPSYNGGFASQGDRDAWQNAMEFNLFDPVARQNRPNAIEWGRQQGLIAPHEGISFGNTAKKFAKGLPRAAGSLAKAVAPVALGALGGMALSGTGLFAGAAGAGAGGAGAGSSAFGGMGTGTMSTVGGGAASTGAAAGGAGWAGAGGSILPSGFGVGGGVGLGSTTGGSLGFMGPAVSGGSVAGSGLGLSAGGATAGAGAGAAASGGLNGFLSGIFGSGAGKLGTAGTLGVLGQIGSDFYMANRREDAAREAAGLADPFASQRPQYQQQLQQHMTDPSSFMNSPQVEQAVEAAARKMAAMGYNLSPNQADEIRRAAMDQYYRQTDVLSNLSGAGFGPGNAGSVSLGGMEGANAQRYQGLADIGTLVGDIYSRYRGSNPTSSQYSLV